MSLSSIERAWLSRNRRPLRSFNELTIDRTCSISRSLLSSAAAAASPVEVSDEVIIGGTESLEGTAVGDGARWMLSCWKLESWKIIL